MDRSEQLVFGRRALMLGAASVAGIKSTPSLAREPEPAQPFPQGLFETEPNFGLPIKKLLAGIRPHREESYRLEREDRQGKIIIHNYGYSGGGITMSWGCAHHVAQIVRQSGVLKHSTKIVVLGAGVMGLTAATKLLELSPSISVRIITDKMYPDTTSHVAGGQWSPTSVSVSPAVKAQYMSILTRAFLEHDRRFMRGFGVYRRMNYTLDLVKNFDDMPDSLIPPPQQFDRLPFKNVNVGGYTYRTLLVEPPVFLKRLHRDLANSKRATFVPGKRLTDFGQVAELPETIIINCTGGLNAAQLWNDSIKVTPVKGQLVVLAPQSLKYLFSGHHCGQWDQYMFPRTDGLIIGGTYQTSYDQATVNPETTTKLLNRIRGFFSGDSHCLNHPNPDA